MFRKGQRNAEVQREKGQNLSRKAVGYATKFPAFIDISEKLLTQGTSASVPRLETDVGRQGHFSDKMATGFYGSVV